MPHSDQLSLTSNSHPERIKILTWIGESYILGTVGDEKDASERGENHRKEDLKGKMSCVED
jgi:hypothetical protein